MRRAGILIAAVLGAAGCHGGPGRNARHCAPAACLPSAAAPRVEVQRCEQVVHVPSPTVVVDMPAAPQAAQPQAAQPFAAAPPALPFTGTPLAANVGLSASGASVQSARPSRTRVAFAPTVIHIPFPWLRLVPVEEPEEVTFRFAARQTATAHSAGAFSATAHGVMPMGVGMPMGVMPMGAMPMGVGMPMGAMPMGVMPQAAPQAAQPQACPPGVTPEQVQEFTRRIQMLESQLRATQQPCPPVPCPPLPCPPGPVAPICP